ncbi:MAG: integrase arm-type DNA-binding domain-containing protein [Psychromonas sp.]|nr:integrase arm-type DNA-binding domain-containing protein [Psychromonas sp.]
MGNTTKQLTNTEVSQAKPKTKKFNLADGRGLALRVKPSGSKLWVFNYPKPFTKKRTNMSFGVYPEVSLSEARSKRQHARELLYKNTDPQTHKLEFEQKSKEAIENTFGKLADKWLNLKQQQVKEITAKKARKILNKHFLPAFRDIPLEELKPKTVIDAFQPLFDDGKNETVKQLCRYINEIMRLAVASGVIEFNYLADITKLFPSPNVQNMLTIKPEKLPDLMTALNEANVTEQRD